MKLLNAAIIQYVDKKNRVFRHESNKKAHIIIADIIASPIPAQFKLNVELRNVLIWSSFLFSFSEELTNQKTVKDWNCLYEWEHVECLERKYGNETQWWKSRSDWCFLCCCNCDSTESNCKNGFQRNYTVVELTTSGPDQALVNELKRNQLKRFFRTSCSYNMATESMQYWTSIQFRDELSFNC